MVVYPLLAGLLAVVPLLDAGSLRGRAEYIGGTLAAFTEKQSGGLDMQNPESLAFVTRQAVVRVPWERINQLEYGQKVDRRYAMAILISPVLLLSKKRTHYLTIGYSDDSGRQQAMIFRVDKGDIRAVLVTLEARTGVKVEFQDDDARKAGKG